ncbi:MAG: hypothetical protein INR64_06110 [Caulobacteraceae bacterium]|nr:hypothetical protein [Caulobacter sp.]
MSAIADLLRSTGLWLLIAVLLVGCIASTEIGRALGRRSRRARPEEDKDASGLAAAALGLFALLIAFTYSLSLSRYDARRHEVLEEANAIGTAANYALMLPADHRAAVLGLLHDYTGVRLRLGVPYDETKFARDIAASNALQSQMWSHAMQVTAAEPQSLPAYRFVAALNEMTNISEARVTALRNHDPATVLVMLIGVAFIAMGFSGYASALAGAGRHGALLVMAATLSLLVALTVDLDRPNRGTITISVKPLQDALAQLPAA